MHWRFACGLGRATGGEYLALRANIASHTVLEKILEEYVSISIEKAYCQRISDAQIELNWGFASGVGRATGGEYLPLRMNIASHTVFEKILEENVSVSIVQAYCQRISDAQIKLNRGFARGLG